MSQIDTDREKIGRRAFQQILDVFIFPYISSLQAEGKLSTPVQLDAAQVIFYPDGRKPQIRLNSEVQAIAQVRIKPGVQKQPGDYLAVDEIEGLDKIALSGDDDPDCGHVTIIKLNDLWYMTFDFRYNKNLSRSHLDTAKEFYSAAEFAAEKKFWSAFADNLFNACELNARALLLSMPDPQFRKKSKHTAIKSRYNRFASLGNVPEEHRVVFNKLYDLRTKARYLKGDVQIAAKEAKELLGTVGEMLEYTGGRLISWHFEH
jgi:hypothetical protein